MFQKPNFKNIALFLAVFVFFAGFTVSSAKAQSICLQQGHPQSFTYTSTFSTAGSASAVFTLIDNVIIVQYKNTSTANTYLSGIAFNTVEHVKKADLKSSTATLGWATGTGSGGGLGSYDLFAYGNGNSRRLSQGQSGTATYILKSVPTSFCISPTIVHLTSLPDGSSEKPVGVIDSPGTVGSGGGIVIVD